MRQRHSFLSVLLAATLTILPITAQTSSPSPDNSAAKATSLQVRLQGSDAAALPINSTSLAGYTLQVLDANGTPVASAAVALRMPDDGPSGTFAEGNKASVAYTDAKGVVRFPRIRWNGLPGTAMVRVTVVKGAAHSGALIQQSLITDTRGTALASAKPPAAPASVAASADATSPSTVVAPFGPNATSAAAAQTPSPSSKTAVTATLTPPVPGTPVAPSTPVSHPGATSAALQTPSGKSASGSRNVSVTDTSATGGNIGHSGISKKWVLLAVVAAGAGVGAALAMSGHGSSSAAAAPGLTIGAPTLSLGH